MKSMLTASDRDAILFHAAFTLLCVCAFATPLGIPTGVRLLGLTVIYNAGLPGYAIFRNRREWLPVWKFSLCLSIFQLFPDWFLSASMGILVFPEDGLFKIGTVSGYMPLLWTVPIFIIIYAAEGVRVRRSLKAAYIVSAAAAFLIFTGSEATMWLLGSWYPQNVTIHGHIALYIIVPETLLGLYAYYAYRAVEGKGFPQQCAAAFSVMLLYLGAASFFYLLIERIL